MGKIWEILGKYWEISYLSKTLAFFFRHEENITAVLEDNNRVSVFGVTLCRHFYQKVWEYGDDYRVKHA